MLKTIVTILLTVFCYSSFCQPYSRLIAVTTKASIQGGYALFDSTHYYYSKGKGGELKSEYIKSTALSTEFPDTGVHCDFMIYYKFKGAFSTEHTVTQEFDNLDRLVTTTHFEKGTTATIRMKYTYPPGKVSRIYQKWFPPQSIWYDNLVTSYQYNGGLLAGDSMLYYNYPGVPNPLYGMHVNQYHYNQQGLLDSQIVYFDFMNANYQLLTYMYNASGQLDSVYSHAGSPGNWMLTMKTFYDYDINQNLITKRIEELSAGIWAPYNRTIYTYDTSHNLLTAEQANGYAMAYKNVYKYYYTYNSYNQVTLFYMEEWDSNTSTWVDFITGMDPGPRRSYFYYELYYPSGIDEIRQDKISINVYPNPASSFITLEFSTQPSKSFTASIYDIQGRLYRQWNENSPGKYKRSIPVDNLPAGNYIIKLSGGIEDVQQFVITR